jgi:hypothetical protein
VSNNAKGDKEPSTEGTVEKQGRGKGLDGLVSLELRIVVIRLGEVGIIEEGHLPDQERSRALPVSVCQ